MEPKSVHQTGTAGCKHTAGTHAYTQTQTEKKIHQYLEKKIAHLSPINVYYLKSAFHTGQDAGIRLTLIA